MQVAVVSTDGLEGWQRAVSQALAGPTQGRQPHDSRDPHGPHHPFDVLDLRDQPPSNAQRLAREADLVLLLIGGDARQVSLVEDLYRTAVAAEHVTIVAVVIEPVNKTLATAIAHLEAEHPSVRVPADQPPEQAVPTLAELVRASAAKRARFLWHDSSYANDDATSREGGAAPRKGREASPAGVGRASTATARSGATVVADRPTSTAGAETQAQAQFQALSVGVPQPRPRPRRAAEPQPEPTGRHDRAADDQWNEAATSWHAARWEPMARHLRRTLDLRPLDAEASLWLARLLAASQRRTATREAIKLSDSAARVAEGMSLWPGQQDGSPKHPEWAAAAWLWVARLARAADPNLARAAAQRAATLAPTRADPWVEKTVQHLLAQEPDPCLQAALEAYRRQEWSLIVLQEDPDLREMQTQVRAVLAAVAANMARRVAALAALVDDDVRPAYGSRDQLSAAELGRLPLPVLAMEGRGLGQLILRALSLEAAELAADGRRLAAEALARAGGGLVPAPVPGRIGREVYTKGAVAVTLLVLSGVGLAWVFGSVVWAMLGLALAALAMFVTLRVAAESTVADAAVAGRQQVAWSDETAQLRARIEAFEAATLDWPRVLSTTSPDRAKVGDLVALSATTVPDNVAVDPELLPPDLRLGSEPIGEQLRLYRVVHETAEHILAARWAAYFPSPPAP